MFSKVLIIPTGNEIKDGIVIDTDSPMVMKYLLNLEPQSYIVRSSPINDVESLIEDAVLNAANCNYDLVFIIGGSGGGHRYSLTLGKDYTHSVLETLLRPKHSGEIYGKNGHMWCKLICGYVKNTFVINLPGPYREAKAAMEAFIGSYAKDPNNYKEINQTMLNAVIKEYSLDSVK